MTISSCLAIIVAFLHLGFMYLEVFLWQKPKGLKIFNLTPDKAAASAVLAANQGVYNAILALGLIASLFLPPQERQALQIFIFTGIVIAGAYGACTVSRKILFIQALPAALGLAASLLGV